MDLCALHVESNHETRKSARFGLFFFLFDERDCLGIDIYRGDLNMTHWRNTFEANNWRLLHSFLLRSPYAIFIVEFSPLRLPPP